MSGEDPGFAVETLPVLETVPGVVARFLGRIPGVDVAMERDEAMAALAPHHLRLLAGQGLGDHPLVTAEQIHGREISLVTEPSVTPLPGADGLLTAMRGITLGIYVADCAPVWIVSRDGRAGALLHSGRKGTGLGIATAGIGSLCKLGGLAPSDLILVIGPCIRPPCYETDFAAEIRAQARDAGVSQVHDDLTCTACRPENYYSYRREKGMTGRMLATLTLLP